MNFLEAIVMNAPKHIEQMNWWWWTNPRVSTV